MRYSFPAAFFFAYCCLALAGTLGGPTLAERMAAAGRPRADINMDEVVKMRRLGLRWQVIADRQKVHINTLTNWRRENGFEENDDNPLFEVDDDDLDVIVKDFLDGQGQRGDQIMNGHLTSLGIAATRQRVRDSVKRVDAAGRQGRKKQKKKRVEYNVFSPHKLWHMDGWHKLNKKAGIVVHGCIDGATRKVIYVRATDNNSASTLLEIFVKATKLPDGSFFLPSRLRGDRGGENTRVAELMIAGRGGNRGSFLVGASWQNQRTEAFWRYINSQCLGYFIDLIAAMTKARVYDSMRPGHRWVFQYLFMGLINQELDTYIDAWNNHPIRTEKFFTPLQLEYLLQNQIPDPVTVDPQTYGVFDDEEVEQEDEQDPDKQAVVNAVKCELSDDKLQFFCRYVPRLNKDCPKTKHASTFKTAVKYYNDLLAEQEEEEAEEFAAQQQHQHQHQQQGQGQGQGQGQPGERACIVS